MGKPIGTYVTLEAGQLGNDEEEYQQEVAKELSVQLQKLIPDPETEKSVLVVGAWKPAGDGGCAGDRGWRTDCLLTGTSFSSLALQRITGKK